jgi:hypothetical protein
MNEAGPSLSVANVDLLTVSEAGTLLRISTQSLRRWRKLKRGPDFVRVGRRVLYPTNSIQRWLANRVRVMEQ